MARWMLEASGIRAMVSLKVIQATGAALSPRADGALAEAFLAKVLRVRKSPATTETVNRSSNLQV